MKRLKLGKIQWISLLVVSAMFANLCSHMVLAAASEQTKAKVTTTATKKTTKTKQEEYKAFWFSYYDYDTYRETNKKRNAKTFRTYFTKVVKKEKSFGMNRVIVQVRPFGDAIYKSKYFPWSKYISGKQGRSPGYDPLKIMVDVAHKNGMKIEAWVNPYRVTIGSTNYSKLSKNNPARKWHAKKSTSRNVLAYNGSLYYNPSKKDVRNLIINGAKEIVKKGLAPLGKEYGKVLSDGMESGWIDVYENEGKRSGAYSWGAYGCHPFVLMNYQDNLNNVFTLAHEMGHSMHSYYSDKNQPYIYAGYRIFVAEVASTCNEALLMEYLLKNTEEKKEKMYLINYFLEQFKGTLYRQTMFAEFEKITHEMAWNKEPLTAEVLCDIYYKLNQKYFGEDIVIDKEIALEWARIPHFYTPFYVYQYATGYSAAIAISRKILSGDERAKEGYFKFLSGGSSMNPIDLLRLCNVDMAAKEPIESALKLFGELLDEMEEML